MEDRAVDVAVRPLRHQRVETFGISISHEVERLSDDGAVDDQWAVEIRGKDGDVCLNLDRQIIEEDAKRSGDGTASCCWSLNRVFKGRGEVQEISQRTVVGDLGLNQHGDGLGVPAQEIIEKDGVVFGLGSILYEVGVVEAGFELGGEAPNTTVTTAVAPRMSVGLRTVADAMLSIWAPSPGMPSFSGFMTSALPLASRRRSTISRAAGTPVRKM